MTATGRLLLRTAAPALIRGAPELDTVQLGGTGQLGVGDELPRLRPALVAGGLGFATVSVGYGHTCGRSIAGTLYCWGQNFAGALGDGSTSQRDVPVKVAGQP